MQNKILILLILNFVIVSFSKLNAGINTSISKSCSLLNVQNEEMQIQSDTITNDSFKTSTNEFRILFNQNNIAGAISKLNPNQLLHFDNVKNVNGLIYGRVPGNIGELNIRGLGNAIVIIDGFPRPIESVRTEEINDITILKDAHAAMLYGTQGKNGVIVINTKNGLITRKININVEYGYSKSVRIPSYLDAADYMTLYNEARLNDGLTKLYSESEIENTRTGINSVKYPNVDYYSSNFLREFAPTTNIVAEFSEGNENAQYYVNAGFVNSGTFLDMGEGAHEKNQRLNVRSNINFKINNSIKSYIGIGVIYDINRRANGNFWLDASVLRPNLYPPLIDTSLIVDQQSLKQSATLLDEKYILGGTSNYLNNVWGNLNFGGHSTQYNTALQFNSGIDFDLKSILKGLTFKTFIGLDYYNQYFELQNNTYAVYEPMWITDVDNKELLSVIKHGEDKFEGTQGVSAPQVLRNIGFYGILDYNRIFQKKHLLSFNIVAYADESNQTGLIQTNKNAHLGSKLSYLYNNKYYIDFTGALVNSVKLPPSNRIGLSPAVGLAWILSKENFLNNSRNIQYLKLKATASNLKTDQTIPGFYLYEGQYSQSGVVTWNDNFRSIPSFELNFQRNYSLSFEERQEINVGIEGMFFKNSLWFEVNAFNTNINNIFTQRSSIYPDYLGGIYPYENYGENNYRGLEIGADWEESTSREFNFNIGTTLTFLRTEVVKRDELWGYKYLYRTGKPVNAIYGLEALGLFNNLQEIENQNTIQTFGNVQPGDIKYKDQNNDGIIDAKDEIYIGKYTPDVVGSFKVKLQFKNLTFFTISTFNLGSERLANNEYYWIFGDRKYSTVTLSRWNKESMEKASYPRLSTMSNSNNFRTSTFWLYNSSKISIDRIQFTYKIQGKKVLNASIKNVDLYMRIENIAMFSKNKEKMELNVGTEPQHRYYAVGLKALF